eukprot:scaffold8046_cov121-Skeletonema_marinoi.AAC.1
MSRAAKKRRTSNKCSLSPSTRLHQHQYLYQQKSSSVQGLMKEESSSAFARLDEEKYATLPQSMGICCSELICIWYPMEA